MIAKKRKIHPAYLLCAAVLLVFFVKMTVFIATEGDGGIGVDTGSELNSSVGAQTFVQKGFWRSSGLPEYGRFNVDSPSKAILDSVFYTHYLPGPDYVMALTYAVFGAGPRSFQWTRLVPLLSVLFAATFFLWAATRYVWRGLPWIAPIAAAFLLFPPGMRPWAVSLHGHAYSSAFVLTGLALGILSTQRQHWRYLLAAAFAVGFAQNYMLLTGCFVVFFAPVVGSLLVYDAHRRNHRNAAILSFTVGVGLVSAFGLHFLQIVHQFSFADAVADQFGTYLTRTARVAGEPSRIQLLGRYSDHTQTFWGLSTISMLWLGAFLGWIHPGPARYRLSLFLAVLVAGVGSYAWIMVVKNHSIGHTHVNPRVFYLMYVAFIASLGAVLAVRYQVPHGQTKTRT